MAEPSTGAKQPQRSLLGLFSRKGLAIKAQERYEEDIQMEKQNQQFQQASIPTWKAPYFP